MAYNKKADENYRKKIKTIGLKYTLNELDEYNRLIKYCNDNNLSYQSYIKSLAKADLDKKGIPYTD